MAKRVSPACTAAPLVPSNPTLEALRAAASGCKACALWKTGRQTVFGEGPAEARLMLIGEGPGRTEDIEGKPFVGVAGRLLDQALDAAGIMRRGVYVTNIVKHFKRTAGVRGGAAARPNAVEIAACRPWLDAEIALVKPAVVVCLGSVAAQALLGSQFRVTRQRGEVFPSPVAPFVIASLHPAAILRAGVEEVRLSQMAMLIEDLRKAGGLTPGPHRP